MTDREGKPGLKEKLAANLKHSGTRIILLSGIAMTGLFVFFAIHGGSKLAAGNTQLSSMPEQQAGPKKTQTDPQLRKLIEQADAQRLADAAARPDASAMPTMPDKKAAASSSLPGDRLLAAGEEGQRLERAASGRSAQGEPSLSPEDRAVIAQRVQTEKADHDKRVSQQGAYMKALLGRWSDQGDFKVVQVSKSAALPGGGGTGTGGTARGEDQAPGGAVLFAAGQTLYARNVLYVNSDKAGTPVVAEIQSTAVFHGARLIGSFQLLDDQMMLKFDRMNWRGQDYKIDAVAIDPDANSVAFSDNSDPRYVARFGLQLGAQFLAGVAKVAQQSGSTAIVTGTGTVEIAQPAADMRRALWGGLGNAGTQLSNDVAAAAPKGPLVEIYANSGMGIMFLQSVREPAQGQTADSTAGAPAARASAQAVQDAASQQVGPAQQQDAAPVSQALGQTARPIVGLNGLSALTQQQNR